MTKKIPPVLDAIAAVVLAYHPEKKKKKRGKKLQTKGA